MERNHYRNDLQLVRKHQAPNSALRPLVVVDEDGQLMGPSESTERQKVH